MCVHAIVLHVDAHAKALRGYVYAKEVYLAKVQVSFLIILSYEEDEKIIRMSKHTIFLPMRMQNPRTVVL